MELILIIFLLFLTLYIKIGNSYNFFCNYRLVFMAISIVKNLGSPPMVNSLIHLTLLHQLKCHVKLIKKGNKIIKKENRWEKKDVAF